jgi:MFS family permease
LAIGYHSHEKAFLLVIFLTVFIDLIGFGIALPLLPIYSDQLGAHGFVIGIIMASYSAMHFSRRAGGDFLIGSVGDRSCSLASGAAIRTLCSIGSGLTNPQTALAIILARGARGCLWGEHHRSSLHRGFDSPQDRSK